MVLSQNCDFNWNLSMKSNHFCVFVFLLGHCLFKCQR
jgi:hypothetical protein